MEFLDVVAQRRMVRGYTSQPVEPAALDRILAAALRGPSAGFAQGVELVVVTSTETRTVLAEAAQEQQYVDRGFEPWLSAAPVHVVIAIDPDAYHRRYGEADKMAADSAASWPTPYWWVDAGAALMALLLAVTNEGLAAGFLGSHAFTDLAGAVGLPAGFETIGLATIGHSRGGAPVGSAQRPRRPRRETIHSERWGVPRSP